MASSSRTHSFTVFAALVGPAGADVEGAGVRRIPIPTRRLSVSDESGLRRIPRPAGGICLPLNITTVPPQSVRHGVADSCTGGKRTSGVPVPAQEVWESASHHARGAGRQAVAAPVPSSRLRLRPDCRADSRIAGLPLWHPSHVLVILRFRLAEGHAAGPAGERRKTGSEGNDGEARRNSWRTHNDGRCSHRYGSCV